MTSHNKGDLMTTTLTKKLTLILITNLSLISAANAGIVSDDGLATQFSYSANQISEVDQGVLLKEIEQGIFIEERAIDSAHIVSHQRTWGDKHIEARLELMLGMVNNNHNTVAYSQAPLSIVLPLNEESNLEKLTAADLNTPMIEFLNITRLDSEKLLLEVSGKVESFRNGKRNFNISIVLNKSN
jgi:hypothetical protein